MLKKQDIFLKHIIKEIDFIVKHTKEINYDNLIQNEILKRAIVRSLEIIGEAVKKLDFEFKKENNEIEWKKIAGLRDKLIHHYFGINWEIVWDVIRNKIPELEKNMKDLLKKIV